MLGETIESYSKRRRMIRGVRYIVIELRIQSDKLIKIMYEQIIDKRWKKKNASHSAQKRKKNILKICNYLY